MIVKIIGKCQYKKCDQDATTIACGRVVDDFGSELGAYCELHAEIVADQDNPEYNVGCPNCGCRFGVN